MALLRDDFELWLFRIDDELSCLFASLPRAVARALDYSSQSLGVLEKWLLESYASVGDILSPSEKATLDRLSRYVGESFRRALGGTWDIELNDPRNAYCEMPTIGERGRCRECPVTVVTASLDRRSGTYMESVLRSLLEHIART